MSEMLRCKTCRHWIPHTSELQTGGCDELNHPHGNHLAYLNIAGAGPFPDGQAVIITRPDFGCVLHTPRPEAANG